MVLTVSCVHDVVQVVDGQTAVCLGFAGDSVVAIVALAAWFVPASSRKEVRCAVVSCVNVSSG